MKFSYIRLYKSITLLVILFFNFSYSYGFNKKIKNVKVISKSNPGSHAHKSSSGSHVHNVNELMYSYRYMNMAMKGNRIGTRNTSDVDILLTSNYFAGMPMQPTNLRIIPKSMDMHMHMIGVMYGVSNDLILMLMSSYMEKSMKHVTYNLVGSSKAGEFKTSNRGLSDTKLSSLYDIFDNKNHHLHLNLGISFPTGSIDKKSKILAPTGMTPTVRMPYSMQF